MPVWKVRGGAALEGTVELQGSKNAVLPVLAASLLPSGETRLSGCPNLLDVDASVEILRHLGCTVMQNGGVLAIDSREITGNHIPHALMLRMRSSVMFLGAILARCGEVRLSAPGGCELGARPIDLHLKALKELGAEVEQTGGEVICSAGSGLRGCHINLDFPSVGATENVMLCACAAEGETVLTNAAREPEIVDLQDYLNAAGAAVSGAGSAEIRILGRMPDAPLTEHRVMPDRIAGCTWLCAAACAGGSLELLGARSSHMEPVIAALRELGCAIHTGTDRIVIRVREPLHACRPVSTKPYPGFPTDAQALLMAACLRARGTSVIVENIFENRFRHVPELRRMGADVRLEGRVAMVTGVPTLCGAPMTATDLRGGASLLLAALGAEGESTIYDEGHIGRGYAGLDRDLRSLGADVAVTPDSHN